ncbi:MAG: anaerobic sulfatase maturase [Bacilli bacterium]|jgi:uncharacterized protein|nr:anaerobic sulfatase maturase [Bacilli bacterium]
MPAISVMIKPASDLCNMACRYCFYRDEAQNRDIKSFGIMEEKTIYEVLRKILSFAQYRCVIAFQGGEPTLTGLSFFKKVVQFEKELNVNSCKIENAIQTNGYILDEEWCRFFKDNNFLVGISLDGNQAIHDANRLDKQDQGTFSRVMESIGLLKKYEVDFNVLCVVTALSALNIKKIYRFYTAQGLDYQQYIPCLDPLGEKRGGHSWSLTPEVFEKYLKDLFDCWYEDAMKGNLIYIRYFDNLLAIMLNQQPEACGMLGQCSKQLIVEADGSVYPCDFYALDEWKLGNLVYDSLEDIEKNREEKKFISISAIPHPDCLKCKWAFICRGGCRRDRSYQVNAPLEKNYFCAAYYRFFSYAYPKMEKLIQKLVAEGKI